MRRQHSIDISGTRFAELLASRRRALGLSKIDLAEKSGLSGRVIHQIETRSRGKFLEKTLLLLAEAVETPLQDLLQPVIPGADSSAQGLQHPDDSPPGDARPAHEHTPQPMRVGRRGLITILSLVAALLVSAFLITDARRTPGAPRIELVGNTIHVRSATTGRLIWSRSFAATINFADPSPWRDGTVIAGPALSALDGGRILLLDGKTGETIWERSPDPDLAKVAFGEGILEGLNHFAPIEYRPLDVDGDGEPEVAVSFFHMRNYPSCVMALNRRGDILGEYFSRGHVYAMEVVDLDGQGKQALICGGANNRVPYHGGTVFILDREHWSGAAVDSINGGNLEVGDGSRRRILMPAFEAQMLDWMGFPRLRVGAIRAGSSPEGSIGLLVRVGVDGADMHLMLDPDLNPIWARPTDGLVREVGNWPVDDPATYGPNCPEWRAKWMQGIIRVDKYALAAADLLMHDESYTSEASRAAATEQ